MKELTEKECVEVNGGGLVEKAIKMLIEALKPNLNDFQI